MARWFDETAKASARRDVAGTPYEGVTRRTALKRGAVVAGVAWTAPMLMQTRAYAGASMCASTTTPCFGTGTNTTVACCATGTNCVTDIVTGAPTCAAVDTAGGTCSNSGQGICDKNAVQKTRCNGNTKQCNECAKTNICGGEGAFCDGTTVICAPNLECRSELGVGGESHCRKRCSVDGDCNTNQICDSSGYCAHRCGTGFTSCTSGQACVVDVPGTATVPERSVCQYDPPS